MKNKLSFFFSSGRRLLAGCYAALLAVSLVWAAFNLCQDRYLRATGQLTEQQLSASAFELVNLQLEEDGVYTSTTDDPRMVLTDCPERVSRVDMEVTFLNMDPGEFTLFYKPRDGMEDFDANFRVWGNEQSKSHYSFSVSCARCYGLRIDPGMYAGMQFTIQSITLNAKQPALSFFVPSNFWLVSFIVAPALIASVIQYIIACRRFVISRRSASFKEGT